MDFPNPHCIRKWLHISLQFHAFHQHYDVIVSLKCESV